MLVALVIPDAPVWLLDLRCEVVSESTFLVFVFSELELIREAREGPAGVKVRVFGAKSCGAEGAWNGGGGSRCFMKKSEIRLLVLTVFDMSSAALTFIKCFLLVRWISKFLCPPVPMLTSM